MDRRLPLVAIGVAGLVAMLGAAVGLATDRSTPADFGAPLPATSAAPPAEVPTGTPMSTSASPVPRPTPALAVTLTIPSLHVRAIITPVDAARGRLAVPGDPASVGWWTGSALPGSPGGTVVLDGHVDEAGVGPGALYRLTALRPGDLISLGTDDRRNLSYKVTARRVYVKASGLPADLFDATGPARLVLITCGGPFDEATGSYQDNVAVFAVPTAAS